MRQYPTCLTFACSTCLWTKKKTLWGVYCWWMVLNKPPVPCMLSSHPWTGLPFPSLSYFYGGLLPCFNLIWSVGGIVGLWVVEVFPGQESPGWPLPCLSLPTPNHLSWCPQKGPVACCRQLWAWTRPAYFDDDQNCCVGWTHARTLLPLWQMSQSIRPSCFLACVTISTLSNDLFACFSNTFSDCMEGVIRWSVKQTQPQNRWKHNFTKNSFTLLSHSGQSAATTETNHGADKDLDGNWELACIAAWFSQSNQSICNQQLDNSDKRLNFLLFSEQVMVIVASVPGRNSHDATHTGQSDLLI